MNILPFTFKEFTGDTAKIAEKTVTPFLPGGRFRGEVPPPPPVPTFTEEQLKAAEREAYKKGFLEGSEDGRKQSENEQTEVTRKLTDMCTHFASTLAPIFADYRRMCAQLKEDVPNVALAISRKIAGAALKDNVQAAVEDLVTRCVTTMLGQPALVITVHESLATALEQKLATLMKDTQEAVDITVMRDAAMNIADCRVEWKNGEFMRNTGRLWQEIERAVEALGVSASHDAGVQAEALKATLPEEVQTQADALPPAEDITAEAPKAEGPAPETNNPTPDTPDIQKE